MLYSELNIMYIWYSMLSSEQNIVLSRVLCTSGTVCCTVSRILNYLGYYVHLVRYAVQRVEYFII